MLLIQVINSSLVDLGGRILRKTALRLKISCPAENMDASVIYPDAIHVLQQNDVK